ncbi:glycoside hydrolase family 13 protein [Kocuria marina]|uniref:glycoside hydrolase family 13 protein n=1 Tax=Kocuria sp. KRD140 TaxID=2729723 RepID=UPI002989DD39|nr:glycoside hydrolase family 13 protein [Kocuria marina]MCT1722064.1 glycoside hydrolase family 13 protein [Kocuria marina]MCT1735619.1 glycoside hydrolase family 13 protein [Kocuria marina]MCT2362247.1 glycoside hydrolase family 13 protein [Kocuria marina]
MYPRSFKDSNGDGMGDLGGVTQKLPYLKHLGVDAVWLSPFYLSPQHDAGYDVADYRTVDPRFGSLEDFDRLREEAHRLGLKIIVDLVPNHTSEDHEWFRAALTSEPGSPERDRYMFREGRGENGEEPPNNWKSLFGGRAWTRVPDGQWYLHLFDSSQPDLNWENPEVWEEFRAILRFWLDRGADGFRVDVAHGMIKAPGLPDWDEQVHMVEGTDAQGAQDEPDGPSKTMDTGPYFDQDGVHEIYRDWHTVLQEYPGDRMLVVEAWVGPAERLARYVRPDEAQQAFNFDFLVAGWHRDRMRDTIEISLRANAAVGAPSTWVLSNHDTVRHASRYGLSSRTAYPNGIGAQDEQPHAGQGLRRARAAALVELSLPGSAYIYQGDELGLPEHTELPDAARQDPTFHRTAGSELGRDGARVPLPWAPVGDGLGFGPDPWLPQPESFAGITVDHQLGDPQSTLNLYRRALELRHDLELGTAEFAWHPLSEGDQDVLAYTMSCGTGETVLVAANLGESEIGFDELSRGELLLASGQNAVVNDRLSVDSAVWLRLT